MIWIWLSLIISWLYLNNSYFDEKNQSHSASLRESNEYINDYIMIWMWLSLIISWLLLNNSYSVEKNQSHPVGLTESNEYIND